jgi:TRAP-type C4-dicarboxylate transport system permease small subunit
MRKSTASTPTTADRVPIYGRSSRAKIAGIVLRSIFMLCLVLVTMRVSAPQHVGSTWLDIPTADMVRVALGLGFCLWVLVHMFILPKDARAYTTWAYLGLALAPLSIACVVAVW